jgi:hypothetical protein
VGLYAPGASYSTLPFCAPYRGPEGARDDLPQAFAEEENPLTLFGQPIVEGGRAAVQWWASLVENGKAVRLAGTSVLRPNDDGLVTDNWNTWNIADASDEPPDGWGQP